MRVGGGHPHLASGTAWLHRHQAPTAAALPAALTSQMFCPGCASTVTSLPPMAKVTGTAAFSAAAAAAAGVAASRGSLACCCCCCAAAVCWRLQSGAAGAGAAGSGRARLWAMGSGEEGPAALVGSFKTQLDSRSARKSSAGWHWTTQGAALPNRKSRHGVLSTIALPLPPVRFSSTLLIASRRSHCETRALGACDRAGRALVSAWRASAGADH